MKVVSMMKWLACSAVALVLVAGFPALSQAQGDSSPGIIGTENNVDGLVMQVQFPNADFTFTAGSDGETHFDPFNFGGDTTDDIRLTGFWVSAMPATSRWQQIPGTNDWALPSIGENEPGFTEDVGHWIFPGNFWATQHVGDYTILSADGLVSDVITTFNTFDDNGGVTANLTFSSDPIVPEPGSLTLLGIVGMACYGWRRRKAAVH